MLVALVQRDSDRRVLRAVLERVREQIGDELAEPADVPLAEPGAGELEIDLPEWMGRAELGGDLMADRREFRRRGLHGEAAADPPAGEIEQVGDHMTHAIGADRDPGQVTRVGRRQVAPPGQTVGEPPNRRDRRSKVVAEHSDEALALLGDALGIGELLLAATLLLVDLHLERDQVG